MNIEYWCTSINVRRGSLLFVLKETTGAIVRRKPVKLTTYDYDIIG